MEFHPSLSKLCLWVCFVILQCHRCFGGCAADERAALLEIKASAMSPDYELSTWVEDKTSDYCAWERIKCSDTTGCVSQLHLLVLFWGDSLLNGQFNASLFLPFKDLQYLDISVNGFSGWKSHQGFDKLAKLKKLQFLNLSQNRFNISVLEALSEITSLRTLHLDDNHLGESSSSEISQGIHKLAKLRKLWGLRLGGNKFNSNVLEALSEITSLRALSLDGNYLGDKSSLAEISQGFENLSKLKRLQCLDLTDNNLNHTSILVSLSKLTSLQNLNFSHNQLRMGSSIEFSQGFCELKKLQGIDLSYNNLNGEIPLCLVNFTSLRILDLSFNQLGGTIPTSLTSNMTSLKKLDLSNNQFTGTTWITSSLEQNFQLQLLGLSNCSLNTSTTSLLKFLHGQSELRFIDLSHNNIYGHFPNWLLANNTKLDTIVLNNNSLSGHIRFPIHRRTNLRFIDISKNHIEGHLHTNLGHVLQGVKYLFLSQNDLEGSIPTSLGNMQNLTALDLSDNNFTGEIPGSLAALPITYLTLSNNRLHGQIFLNSSTFDVVRLNNNQFTGIVPPNTHNDWGWSLSLSTLDVSKNNLSGRIPSWIANFTYVKTLVLGDNFFHGSIPLELCNMSYLQFLDLSQNELSGNIPSCLNLSSLRYMQFEGNNLSGSLPSAILRSPELEVLNLNHNHFSGSIPGWLALLENLRVLLLNRNRLSGFVPYELCRSSKISIMDLSHNGLSGKIPPCLGNISFGQSGEFQHDFADAYGLSYSPDDYAENVDLIFRRILNKPYLSQEEAEFMTKGRSSSYKGDILNDMSGMDLSCNNFTGHIPDELEALTAIHALNLSHNQLSGPIPKTLSKLKQLESMDLSHNKLSGEIPSELTDLNFLGTFVVAYNNLSGRLPNMNQQAESNFEGNPYLCGPPLLKQCTGAAAPTDSATATDASLSDVFGVDPISFLASCASAYVVSLMALVIVLYINPYWRRLWFDFIDACLGFMFPFWAEAFYRVPNPFT